MMRVGSLIIPVLNEGGNIENILRPLQALRQRGWSIVVVDGGSTDDTFQKSRPLANEVLSSAPGRAKQMNAGAAEASGDVFVFLHADTVLPTNFESEIQKFIDSDLQWGRFDVTLSGNQLMFYIIAWFINTRSRLTRVSTGDQTLFFKRPFFEKLKGYADVPLMEDVEICKRSRIISEPPVVDGKKMVPGRPFGLCGVCVMPITKVKIPKSYTGNIICEIRSDKKASAGFF